MTKQRPGYQTLTLALPQILVEKLYADAAAQGLSATAVLIADLMKKYGVSRDQLPPNRKAGRKPKP